MNLLKDDSGITYGLIMFIVALAIGIFTWMFTGLLIDLLEECFNSIAYLISPSLANRVTDAVNIYSYMPLFILITCIIFLIVRGLKRNDEKSI